MVHKKVAFRSFIVPQKINTVVFSHYLASEHSSFLSRFNQPWSSSALSGPGYSFLQAELLFRQPGNSSAGIC